MDLPSMAGRSAARLARRVRDAEVGGSNPLAPTILFRFTPEYTNINSCTRCQSKAAVTREPGVTKQYSYLGSNFLASSQRAFCASKERSPRFIPRWRQTDSIWEKRR